MLQPTMKRLEDTEGTSVPAGFPPVVDAHVHLFPASMFAAVWKWFEAHAYPIRYQITSSRLIDFLLSRGVRHVVGLQYAHKQGMSRMLNDYMSKKVEQFKGRLTGLATVYPGEEQAQDILLEAFDSGLKGVKLHLHVQCFALYDEVMHPLYRCCLEHDKPMVIHAGREPASTAYRCDPHEFCRCEYLEQVLKDFPGLKICVPHLGFDEVDAYRKLLERYDNLWLDTTMVLTDYFPGCHHIDLSKYRQDRLMYGSDFPNIPFAWDRELKALARQGLDPGTLERITWQNGCEFFDIDAGL